MARERINGRQRLIRAHLERFLDGQLSDRVNERQSRPDCTLGIVLVAADSRNR